MTKIIFLGVSPFKGKGGISSVLIEYSKIFPKSIFVITTSSSNKLVKLFYGIFAMFKCFYLPIIYPKSIFHIHGASYNSFSRKYLYFKILSFFKVKIIYHIHGAEFHLFYSNSSNKIKKKIQYMINNVDGLICLSNYWKDFFENEFSPKKIKIIPNIVSYPVLQKSKTKVQFEILFLGYISERKGIWLLLDVIESIKEKLSNRVVFNIGGNGEVEKLLQSLKTKKLESIVNYVGWVSGENKNTLMNRADAFILPSYNEGLPISILEAMTYKLPIISTNVGGISEVVKNKVNGFLLEPGNADELKKALEYVVDNTEDFRNFGENSAKLVQPHIPDSVRKDLINFYELI